MLLEIEKLKSEENRVTATDKHRLLLNWLANCEFLTEYSKVRIHTIR